MVVVTTMYVFRILDLLYSTLSHFNDLEVPGARRQVAVPEIEVHWLSEQTGIIEEILH
jgi:hypothetical protein